MILLHRGGYDIHATLSQLINSYLLGYQFDYAIVVLDDGLHNQFTNTMVITQCHGKHQIKVRTRVWDKGTGKLISDDGVRMMQPRKPETLPADKPKAPTEKERK